MANGALVTLPGSGKPAASIQPIEIDRRGPVGQTDQRQYIDKTELLSILISEKEHSNKTAGKNGFNQIEIGQVANLTLASNGSLVFIGSDMAKQLASNNNSTNNYRSKKSDEPEYKLIRRAGQ